MLNYILQELKETGFSKADKKFMLGGSLCLLLLFVFLYFNYQEPPEFNENKEIGTVFVKRNVVRRKANAELSWRNVRVSYPVREKDMIRTSAGSEALLHISDKFKIDMDENTTIVLDFLEDSERGRIRLEQGSARFRHSDPELEGKGLLNLEIVDQDGSFHLNSPGDILLDRSKAKGKLNIVALNDKVELRGRGSLKGIEEVLSPEVLYSSLGKKLSKNNFSFLLQAPEDGAYIFGAGKSVPVKLSWEAKTKAAAQLEISKQKDFSSTTISKKVKASRYRTKLGAGLYYWRLKKASSKRSGESYSAVRKFRIVSQKPLLGYKPWGGEVFSYRTQKPFVNFSWSKIPNRAFYLLEIAKDKGFKETVIKKGTFSVDYGSPLEEGQYYWRVSVKDDLGEFAIRSKVKSFRVIRKKDMVFEIKTNFVPNQTLNMKLLAKKGFLINWEDHPEIFYTEIEFAEDENFSKIIMQKKLSQNFYNFKAKLKAQSYYYRIKSYNKEGELLSKPLVRSFRVKDIKIKIAGFKLLYPKNNVTLHRDKILKRGLRFTWKKPAGTDSLKYSFLLAKDKAFKKIISSKEKMEKESFFNKGIKKSGRYFWKVKALDPSNNFEEMGETKVFAFIVEQMPTISVEGMGNIRGRILQRKGANVIISTPKGNITVPLRKLQGRVRFD